MWRFYGTALMALVIETLKELDQEGRALTHANLMREICPYPISDHQGCNNFRVRLYRALQQLEDEGVLLKTEARKGNSNINHYIYSFNQLEA